MLLLSTKKNKMEERIYIYLHILKTALAIAKIVLNFCTSENTLEPCVRNGVRRESYTTSSKVINIYHKGCEAQGTLCSQGKIS